MRSIADDNTDVVVAGSRNVGGDSTKFPGNWRRAGESNSVRKLKFARAASSAGLYALLLAVAIAGLGELGFEERV